MYKLHSKNFFEAVVWLTKLRELATLDNFDSRNEFILTLLKNLDRELENLQLPLSRKLINRFTLAQDSYKGNKNWGKAYSSMVDELNYRIEDEIGISVVYCLSPSEAVYATENGPAFGQLVSDKFSNSTFDVDEARNCLAFGRWTACVFHLMRVMEDAVKSLAIRLDIENVEKEWGKLLSEIRLKVEAMPKNEVRDEWSAVHSLLYHVKQAWRNNTMHPKDTYTEDEAKTVYSAVRSFMTHLAELK